MPRSKISPFTQPRRSESMRGLSIYKRKCIGTFLTAAQNGSGSTFSAPDRVPFELKVPWLSKFSVLKFRHLLKASSRAPYIKSIIAQSFFRSRSEQLFLKEIGSSLQIPLFYRTKNNLGLAHREREKEREKI